MESQKILCLIKFICLIIWNGGSNSNAKEERRVTVNSNTEFHRMLLVKVSGTTYQSLEQAFVCSRFWIHMEDSLSRRAVSPLSSTSPFPSLESHQPFPVLLLLPLFPCFAASTTPLSSPAGDLSDQAPSAEIEVTLEFTACSHLPPQVRRSPDSAPEFAHSSSLRSCPPAGAWLLA